MLKKRENEGVHPDVYEEFPKKKVLRKLSFIAEMKTEKKPIGSADSEEV